MIDTTTKAMNLMLAANVLLAGGVLLLIVWARSLFLRLEARFQQLEQRELPDVGDRALIGVVDYRLGQLDERLQSMQFETPVGAKPADPILNGAGQPFDYAVRMARQGAGVEDLVHAFGLSPTEAELIHRVHGIPAETTH